MPIDASQTARTREAVRPGEGSAPGAAAGPPEPRRAPGNRCERCGGPERVWVLEGYAQGRPVYRSLCLACAESARGLGLADQAGGVREHLSVPALLIVAGLLLGALGAFGDRLGIAGGYGFGWYQMLGALVGAVCLLVGSVWRVDALGLFGLVLFGLAMCVDLFELGGRPGFGWKQDLAVATGLLLAVAGVALNRRGWRRGARAAA